MPSNGTTLSVNNINNLLHVDSFPHEGCKVGSNVYTTQLDCAWYTAFSLTRSTGYNVTLIMGTGFYNTCATLTEPTTFATINLVGAGIRTSFINKTCSTPMAPVINKPEPIQFSNLTMSNFSIQANDSANSCMDLFGLENPYIANISCSGVRAGSDHEIEIGKNDSGGPGWAEDGVIDNVGAGSPFNAGTAEATITPVFNNGRLTGLSCGSTCGTYDPGGASYIKVFFLGFGHGSNPCMRTPAATATMNAAKTSIASFTVTNPGAGCTGKVDVQAYESFPINVGVELNISDSMTRNIESYVGTTAAITTRGGNTKHYGLHPTNTAIGIINYANTDFEGTECDTIAQYCIDEESVYGSTISGTNTYQAGHELPGSSSYYIGLNATYINYGPQGDLCTGKIPPDYHEFVTASGPVDTGAGTLPPGVTVFGNDRNCGLGGDYTPQLTIAPGGSLLSTGSIINANDGRATVNINHPSHNMRFRSSIWNGSTAVNDDFIFETNVGKGTNPNVTLNIQSVDGGSSGAHSANFGFPITATSFNGAVSLAHTDYWSVAPSLLSRLTALGPVFYEINAGTIKAVTARLSGSMSCTVAPSISIIDLGTSPSMAYGSSTVLENLSTGTHIGAFAKDSLSDTIIAGHYLGFGLSAGVCAKYPQIDATVSIQ